MARRDCRPFLVKKASGLPGALHAAAAQKLARILYTMIKHRTPFDPGRPDNPEQNCARNNFISATALLSWIPYEIDIPALDPITQRNVPWVGSTDDLFFRVGARRFQP